jgi:putative holliday junction resolvase
MTNGTRAAVGRILGIDYGSERIGLALSDPLGIIATPFGAYRNTPTVLEEIAALVAQEHITAVVVGWPLNLKGEEGMKAKEVGAFVERLDARLGMTAVRLDERFTTTIAKQTMIDLGTKKKTRQTDRGRVDAMAAAVLLQGYLDTGRHART